MVIKEINNLIIAHDLIDNWRANNPNLQGFTWSNQSKIQCRLDYLLISKDMEPSLKDVKIYNDHSALGLFLSPEEKKDQQGPGFGNSIVHC